MEKEHQPDSMATITMKPEYPPSEYSASSEPPPAYRQRASSAVQIARIAALTVVAASFILGAFILASSWVAARASCHQLEQLDAMLDKELALEGRAYGNDALLADEPLPIGNAHALHAAPPAVSQPSSPAPVPINRLKEDALNHAESKIDEDRLQKIDDVKSESPNSDESSESDSSAEEDDDLEAMRPVFKMPIHFDLDDLAGAFLASSQKGRMNCVVEKRHDDPMERQFPFNILGIAPRSTQERIAIICHGGDESRPMIPEPQSQVFAFPLSGPVRLPLRPQPERNGPAQEPRMSPFAPLASMPQHRPIPFPLPNQRNAPVQENGMPPFASLASMAHTRNMPFPLSMPWDSSEEQMGGPREMRIHVQRVIAIPAPHNMPPQNMPHQNMPTQNMPPPPETMGPFAPPPPPPQNDQNEQSTVLHQFVPQSAPTQELEQPEVQKIQMDGTPVQMNLPWGLTPEELHAIHRTAEQASQQHRNQQQIDNDMQEMKTIVNTLAAAAEAEAEAQAHSESQGQEEQPGVMTVPLQSPRAPRTLLLPQEMPAEEAPGRPHYMQPRSVRSVEFPHSEKRIKRCACDCK